MNQSLIWLLAVPIVFGIGLWAMTRHKQDAAAIAGIYTVAAMLVVCVCFFASIGSKVHDTEIWNGQVVSKDREHGTYEESYQCNCRTVTSGTGNSKTTTTQCDTCYRTHYTVEWTAKTTVGEFQIDKLDETSRSVYRAPDPRFYTETRPGDPVAKRNTYVNYIQAVPNSLFTPAAADLKKKFAGLIPAYPDKIYGLYSVDRFLSPGWSIADSAQWNADISNALRELGPKKQVNLIVVVAKTDDSNYEYALRDAWEGANKNDVVLVVGSTQYPKIDFVRVISWTKSELFKVQLSDAVMDRGTIDRSVIQLCASQIEQNFQRRQMKEFAYLEGEIDPPVWMIVTLFVALMLGAGGALYFIHKRK